jgi:hypothetical protein
MKKVAILQSNYIPWKGYFDLIAAVDEFILYDEMQYTKRDWRNRNQVKTPQGLKWITVPVKVRGRYFQKINDTEIDGDGWAQDHWRSIVANYKKAPNFVEVSEWLSPFYLERKYEYLSDLNKDLIVAICENLGINTKISSSTDYELVDGQSERLVSLCKQAGGREYISGPSAKNYIDEAVFTDLDVKLTWFDYEGYPEYPQLWGDFIHTVSIIDLIFNCGAKAPLYMKNVVRKD